jgi:hypothetical protein
MGSAESRNFVQSTINVMNRSTNRVALEQATSVRTYQGINITGTGGNVRVSGNKMEASVSLTSEAYLSAMQSNDVKQSIAQELEQMGTAVVSGINFGNSAEVSNDVRTFLNASSETVNSASAKCDAAITTSQAINIAETAGDVEVVGNEMKATVEALAKCRLEAVQGNSVIQSVDQKVKQTAIAEAKGLDPMAFFGIILLVIAIAVVGVIYGATKTLTGTTGKMVPVIVGLLCLAGAGVMAYVVFVWMRDRRELQPPAGTSEDDFFLQYPFLKHTEVRGKCGDVIIDGLPAEQVLGAPASGKRNDLIVGWAKRYNAAVEAHRERTGKSEADYASLPLASAEERAAPPGDAAPLDRRWPHVHAAYIGPGTVVSQDAATLGQTLLNPDNAEVRIWAYGSAPKNHFVIWSQWKGDDAAGKVYSDRPDLYKRTTDNGLMELVNEGKALLTALAAIVAQPSTEAVTFSAAGRKRATQKIVEFEKRMTAAEAQSCGPWVLPFVPEKPPARANERPSAPVTKALDVAFRAGRDLLVNEEDMARMECRPDLIFWKHVMSMYSLEPMLQSEEPPRGAMLWKMLTGKSPGQTIAAADLHSAASGFTAVPSMPVGVSIDFTASLSSRVEPVMNLLARARKDAAEGFVNAHYILYDNARDASKPFGAPSNWKAAWDSNMDAQFSTPFQLNNAQRTQLLAWDTQYELFRDKILRGFAAYDNGSPAEEQSWKDVTVVAMKYVNNDRVPLLNGSDDPFFAGQGKKAGMDMRGWGTVVMGVLSAGALFSFISIMRGAKGGGGTVAPSSLGAGGAAALPSAGVAAAAAQESK